MAAKLYKNEDLNPDGTPKEDAVGIDVTDTKAIQRLLLENIDKLSPEDFGLKPNAKEINKETIQEQAKSEVQDIQKPLDLEPNVQKMSLEVDDIVEFISEVVKEAEKAAIDVAEAIKTAKAKLKELGVPDDLTNEAFEKYQQGTKKPRFALPSGHPDFKKKMEEYNKNQVEQMLKDKRKAQPLEKSIEPTLKADLDSNYQTLSALKKLAAISLAEKAKQQHNQPTEKMENKKLPPVISYIKKQFSKITALAPIQKRRIYIGSGIISIILFITNPSINDFKGYCEFDVEIGSSEANYIENQKEYEDNPDVQTRTYARTSYWLIFSVYQVKVRVSDGTQKKITYIGAFNTFFKTSEKNEYN